MKLPNKTIHPIATLRVISPLDGYKNMTSEKILTRGDAEKLVIEKLNKCTVSEKMFSILKEQTIGKSFGSVFFVRNHFMTI